MQLLSLGLFASNLLAAASPPVLQSGFPVGLGGPARSQGLALADLDGDGAQEIVVVSGEQLAVVGRDGAVRKGFPVVLKLPQDKELQRLTAAPTVCDLDGDGRQEVIVGARDGRLYAVTHEGRLAPGFPVDLKDNIRVAALCAELEGPGRRALLVPTADGVVHWIERDGKRRAGFKVDVGSGGESGVAAGRIGAAGTQLVIGGGDSRLYVLDLAGKPMPGFDFTASFRVSGLPALGDINDDGRNELIFGNTDFHLYALDAQGKPLPGFPIKTGYRIYASPALADLDGDRVLDIVVLSGDGQLQAFDGRGKALFSRRVDLGRGAEASPVIGDLDRDGRPEIVAVGADGHVHVLHADGTPFPGSPLPGRGKPLTAPALGDLDGDGRIELAVLDGDGRLSLYSFPDQGAYPEALLAWPTFGHDSARSGRYWPSPGRFRDLLVAPLTARTTDDLLVSYTFFDLDGDPERDTVIRWYKDGARQAGLDNQRRVPANLTAKHQRWHFTLQAGDNYKRWGESGPASVVFTAAPREIANTPAGAATIALAPDPGRTTDTLRIERRSPASDADGDTLVYRHAWLRDREPLTLPLDRDRLGPELTRKGQRITAVVQAFDGEADGQVARAELLVANTPPGPPDVALQPAQPAATDTLRVVERAPPADPDREALKDGAGQRVIDRGSYRYTWWLNGTPLVLPAGRDRLGPEELRKHDQVKVRVVAHDDEEAGGQVELTATVRNSPPTAPAIAIAPAAPRTADPLRVQLLAPARDADGDAVSYQIAWTRAGQPEPRADGRWEVPAALTAAGQVWAVTVTPSDGEERGATARATATVRNTPPRPPLVALGAHHRPSGEEITVTQLAPPSDDDGDPLTLEYEWLVDGQVAARSAQPRLAAGTTRKHQRWTLRVTPRDPTEAGPAATVDFAIVNTPPTAPAIALGSETPRSTETVGVRVTAPATDRDGDQLAYRYRWYVDGQARAAWPLDKDRLLPADLRAGQRWRVEVSAWDGEVEGAPAYAQLLVRNSPPPTPTVTVLPAQPLTTDELLCQVAPLVDPDGDSLALRYRWLAGGQERQTMAGPRLAAAVTRKGETWHCAVQAHDGQEASAEVAAPPVTIRNTPPPAPQVAIEPVAPGTADDLRCVVRAQPADADLDRVSYRFGWLRDGKPLAAAAGGVPLVPAALTAKGQAWTCTVTPSDGSASGQSASASAAIGNTPPGPAAAALEPGQPRPGEALRCVIVKPSTDRDGDALQYRFSWQKNGVVQPFAPSSQDVPGRLVKPSDIWSCGVQPFDGQAEGPRAESEQVIVRDSW